MNDLLNKNILTSILKFFLSVKIEEMISYKFSI